MSSTDLNLCTHAVMKRIGEAHLSWPGCTGTVAQSSSPETFTCQENTRATNSSVLGKLTKESMSSGFFSRLTVPRGPALVHAAAERPPRLQAGLPAPWDKKSRSSRSCLPAFILLRSPDRDSRKRCCTLAAKALERCPNVLSKNIDRQAGLPAVQRRERRAEPTTSTDFPFPQRLWWKALCTQLIHTVHVAAKVSVGQCTWAVWWIGPYVLLCCAT